MDLKYFLLIVLSSFLHAFYNFLMRKKDGNQLYLNGVFVIAALISFLFIFITKGYEGVPWRNIPYVYLASLFYVLYQIFLNRAYELGGNISTIYPLAVLSPLFIPFWAFFLLGEKISFLTAIGILITVLGAIAIQINIFSPREIRGLFVFKSDSAGTIARFAIAASFVYSFGAVVEKLRISTFQISTYVFLIIGFMSINMMVYMLFLRRLEFVKYMSDNWKIIGVGAVGLFLSFLFFRLALQKIAVSVAVPVRQASIIFAILFGVMFLKENFTAKKLAAVVIIILGIALINIGL